MIGDSMLRCMCPPTRDIDDEMCPLCESKRWEVVSSQRRRLEWRARLTWWLYVLFRHR